MFQHIAKMTNLGLLVTSFGQCYSCSPLSLGLFINHWIKDLTWFLVSPCFLLLCTLRFVSKGSTFVQAFSLGSVQMCGHVRNAPLPRLSPMLDDVPTILNEENGKREQGAVTMAAGLPHFSSGFMRSWGRDTFISVPGLLLVTGRYDDAKWVVHCSGGLEYSWLLQMCLRYQKISSLLIFQGEDCVSCSSNFLLLTLKYQHFQWCS